MANFKMRGLDEYIERLERMTDDADEQIKRAVYVGAGIVANEIHASLATIPTHSDDQYGTSDKPLVGLTSSEKEDVINAFGIMKMRKEERFICVKIGFGRRSRTKSKKYPFGIPNAALMRQVESGSSYRRKTPVIRQATTRSKERALDAMQRELEKQINMIM